MDDLKEQDLKATAEQVSMKTAFTNFKNSAQDIADTYYRLGIAKATQKGADIAAASVSGILMAFFAFFTFLFVFIGLAFWVGTLVNSTAGGFLIVAGFFGLLLGLVIALKGRVIYPMIRNTIVKKVYEQQDNSHHNNV
ncbi:MAG TPA: phage holin family protein [Chitinophagaceae bacterium]|nr:phage holin family protein [Chitinophagaceae bacterium]